MAKMMTQLDIFAKNVMGDGAKSVNNVDVGCPNPDEAKFEVLYNEEVKFLSNKGVFIVQTTRDRMVTKVGTRMRAEEIREWRDHNPTWKGRDGEKDIWFSHEYQNPKDS